MLKQFTPMGALVKVREKEADTRYTNMPHGPRISERGQGSMPNED